MEAQKSRTVAEISAEYSQGCTKAGHLQYQISAMSKDLDTLNQTLRDLNFEAASAQQKEAEAAKAPAEEPKPANKGKGPKNV